MKQKTRMTALCTAAVLMALGASMTAFGAQGWAKEGDVWTYVDSRGDRVTDSWRKSGNYWYYLDSNGEMLTDQWVDDTYYVDVNGVMITNRWLYVNPGTDDAPNSDGGWYYFNANGKVETDGWKTINNRRYYFDTDGTMKYGWFSDNEDTYYLGDENQGWASQGWLCLDYDSDNPPDEGDVSFEETSGSDTAKWFYFQSNGKAVKAVSDTYVSRTINGEKYYFDGNGVMLTGWVSMASESDASDPTGISTFKYFGDDNDGSMSRGWKYLTDDPEDSDDSENLATATSSDASYGDADGSWYYFDSSGTPKYLDAQADSMSKAVSRINGQSYFFDEYGRMQYGLIGIDFGDGTVTNAYFGNSDSDGKMKTDKTSSVTEDNGDRSTFYFNTSGTSRGSGFTGEKNGYLYWNGKLVKADQGSTTQVFEIDGTLYLVNESGKVQTGTRCYKSDGDYRYEIDNGTIYYVDGDRQREGAVALGDGQVLPEISYRTVYTLSEKR